MCTSLIQARALASATATRVFRSNGWRACVTRLRRSTTRYPRVSATGCIFPSALGRQRKDESLVAETKKCRISSNWKGLLSVREVHSRWTEGCECDSVNKAKTGIEHQTKCSELLTAFTEFSALGLPRSACVVIKQEAVSVMAS